MGNDAQIGDRRDVFISYGHADADWVRTLAENLHQSGLDVFFDEWEIGPGDVLIHRIDAGLLASRNGILVVSPVSLTRPYVQAEYAALMARAIKRGQRLIPVLLKDAEMPPLLAARIWIDFRTADGPDYLSRVRELVRALKGERAGPPPRTGELSLPPGSGFTAAGPLSCQLSIGPERTALSGAGFDAAGPPPGACFDVGELQWQLQRARVHWGPHREAGGAEPGRDGLEALLDEVGGKLADAFLPPVVTAALDAAIAEAERRNSSLQLALDIAEPLADLPWETLRLEHTVLVLHPRVELYRRIDIGGAAPAISIPGPLRILVAIGSPDAQNARGELLDMEAELQRILDATEKPRRAGKAFVHILEQGSVAAIHAALAERRYHVLHISCHAAPSTLILETADGAEDGVTAQRLCDAAIPAERAAPLVVLAGCSTGQDAAAADGDGTSRLPGLARTLVRRGVPAVIAMQAPVGDRYATDLIAGVYEALAGWQEARPLTALSHARRWIEEKQRADASASSPEWPTVAFFCAASPVGLIDTTMPFDDLKEAPAPTFDPGVVVRRIGDMVGRRREQRLILRALRAAEGAGVLIHGIGGVGKSTLAAQILHRLADDDGFLLISLKGETDPDRVLGVIGARLFAISLEQGEDEMGRLRRLAGVLREPKYPWRDRFDILSQSLLAVTPIVLLFDNFEDNLTDGAIGDELAALLARWLQAPLSSRLVFTCRHPFALPDDRHERLAAFHLGPLSWAETRKLFWRLDGLKTLSLADQRRAYESVGGHPRALEYLDALLRGGKAHFPDVQERLRKQLKTKGIADPGRWCADTADGLNAALAETVTLAADDVLLDQLLAQLANNPLARRLLIGASVYRVPVDELGLLCSVGELVEQDPDPVRRLQAFADRLDDVLKENPAPAYDEVFQSESKREQVLQNRVAEEQPSVTVPAGFVVAKQRLLDLSLLAPVCFADDEEDMFLVHRWTADALATRTSANEQTTAHQAAAAYWRRRAAAKRPQSREQDIEDLLEARYHLHALGDLTAVYLVSIAVILQLETWSAREWEERLSRETLSWMPNKSREAGALMHQLGNVAFHRGDFDGALDWYRQSLEIAEQLGDRAGMAGSYHQLGMVAQARGDYDGAFAWYHQALTLFKPLGDRAGMAGSYGQLSMVAQARGDYDGALDWVRQSQVLFEQLGDRAGIARSYHQLGMVAQDRGDYDDALGWYRQALALFEQLGDRAGMAGSYHQLGIVAQVHGNYDGALGWYRQALTIFEQLGDCAGLGHSYHNVGMIAHSRGDYDSALGWYCQSLAIAEQLGDRAGAARSYGQLSIVAYLRGDDDGALDWVRQSQVLFEQLGDRSGMAASYHQLGMIAQTRGDYDNALNWSYRALELFEQLGDYVSMATSYGQRGMIAQQRGDYDNALNWSYRALALFEQLGDHARMALTLSQIGVLYTETEQTADAVAFNLKAMALRLQIQSPDARIDLHWLSRQRQTLGTDTFHAIVAEHYNPESMAELLVLLEQGAATDGDPCH